MAQLMALQPESGSFVEEVVALVESDPNYAARLLAAANSLDSAPANPITTPRLAVTRLGAKTVANLLLGVSVAKVFVPTTDDERSLWRHSLQVATLARLFALEANDPFLRPQEAYTAGLLHDIGRFIWFKEAPETLRQIDEGLPDSPNALAFAERRHYGITHSELGARACERWQLPELIVGTIRHHHDRKLEGISTQVRKLATVVRFADIVMFISALHRSREGQPMNDEELARLIVKHRPRFSRLLATRLVELTKAGQKQAEEAARILGV